MKIVPKVLNPIIWVINFFNYMFHLENYRNCAKYKHYDFSKDIKYF